MSNSHCQYFSDLMFHLGEHSGWLPFLTGRCYCVVGHVVHRQTLISISWDIDILGFLRWCYQLCYPKMDGSQWKTLWKWMIWGNPHFRKPPYLACELLVATSQVWWLGWPKSSAWDVPGMVTASWHFIWPPWQDQLGITCQRYVTGVEGEPPKNFEVYLRSWSFY